MALATTAGQTYSILLIDDQSDGGGNGGTLQLSVTEAPPQPIVDVTVDQNGLFNRQTGSATVTCTGGPSQFSLVQTELRQKRGRFTVIAIGGLEVTCDATTRPWSVELVSPNGPFGRGEAANVTMAIACGDILCSQDYEEHPVILRRR